MALIRGEQITGSVASASLAVSASYSTNALSSSFALTASYVQTAQTASYVLNAVSSSFAQTASYVQTAQTASYVLQAVSSSFALTASYVETAQTASYVLNAVSSSFATSASHAANSISSSYASTASYAGDYTLLSEFRQFTSSYESASASFDSRIIANSASIALLSASYNTGSFTGSFTGSLLGTASWANNAISSSYALSSSYAVSSSYALSASYAFNATTASYAHTASYLNPLKQNVVLSGSLLVTQSHISTIDYIDFNISANPVHQEGRIHWIDDTKTLQVDTDVSNFMIELGHQNVVRARNTTGGLLAKGKIVYINGESGNRPTITTASWEGDPTSAATLGWVAQDISDNQTGYVVTSGMLRGVNTNAYSPGTQLYLSSSGDYTSTVPISPNHEVRLGKVITQATQGTIYVDIMNGYEIGELHDVLINGRQNGDLIVWNSGSRVWNNTKQLTGSYGITGSLSISGSTRVIGSSEFDGPTVVSGSLTVIGSSVFYGSASFVYVTASQLALSSSFISVNVFEPVERFGGIKVYDSGSSNATASLAWDSLHNHWVYQNVSGSTYTGGMLLSGPRNSGSLGDEPNLTTWFVPRSDGGDHLDNSQIFSSGSITIVTGSLTATQGVTGSFTGSYIGDGAGLYNIPSSGIVGLNLSQIQSGSVSASISPASGLQINTNVTATSFSGSFSGSGADLSNIPAAAIVGLNLSQIQSGSVSASISPNLGLQINTSVTATSFTGSLFGTASWANNAITASYILNAVSSSFATTASFAQTSSYAFSAVTSSYALTASYIDGGFY